jgi:hypothetical protein
MHIENDYLRQKRERDFQNRVLAAVEKPRRNRFIAFINAPIILWLLSAIGISFLPAVYQARQQCSQVSDTLVTNQFRTQDEINSRIFYFKDAVLSAQSATQLQEILNKRKSSYAEFKTKTLADLLEDTSKIYGYVSLEDMRTLLQQRNSAIPAWTLLTKVESDGVDDELFKELKAQITEQSPTMPNFRWFVPDCSILASIRLAIYGDHKYLRAIPFDRP